MRPGAVAWEGPRCSVWNGESTVARHNPRLRPRLWWSNHKLRKHGPLRAIHEIGRLIAEPASIEMDGRSLRPRRPGIGMPGSGRVSGLVPIKIGSWAGKLIGQNRGTEKS